MIRELARTAWAGGAVIGLTAVLCPAIIFKSILDEESADPLVRTWAGGILKAADVRCRIEGLDRVPERTCVYVCNHQSHFDALLILTNIPRHIRFVAKAELYKIPLFGQAVAAAGNVKVDRAGGEHDRSAMGTAAESVRKRTNVLFFAEGTRSADGVVGPFKKGAAVLALQAGVPILPVAVAGTKDVLPRGSKAIRGGQQTALVIGEPIPVEGMTLDDRDALTQKTRTAVAALYERGQAIIADTAWRDPAESARP